MNTPSKPSKHEEDNTFVHLIKTMFSRTPQTTEDVVAVVDAASENEVIDSDARRIIEGALEVSEKQAREIMIPRTQMTVLKAKESFSSQLDIIIDSAHSRYPVIGDSMDDILGILLTKDLLPLMNEKTSPDEEDSLEKRIKSFLRPAVFIPESKKLNLLLKQFRQNRNHMALIIDEYGSVSGLVTIEDVLEEIVGEIEDEHDQEENQHIRQISETRFYVNAITPIEEFNKYFDSELDNDEFETIGGLVIGQFGHLPKRNETVEYQNFHFFVSQSDSRRLRSLRVTIIHPEENERQA